MGLFYKTIEEFADLCNNKKINTVEIKMVSDMSPNPFEHETFFCFPVLISLNVVAYYTARNRDKNYYAKELVDKYALRDSEFNISQEIELGKVKENKEKLEKRLEKLCLSYTFVD